VAITRMHANITAPPGNLAERRKRKKKEKDKIEK
jgi:hypothetical protein